MSTARSTVILRRAMEIEMGFCVSVNRTFSAPSLQRFFAVISRLGDGVFWYTLMLCLPLLYGSQAIYVSLLMVAVGIVNLLIYKVIKRTTERERPCSVNTEIRLGTAPLDHYSFPSGHTLHAVAFTIIACFFYPQLAWFLIPFASLVASSRVILGLHYPTDVAAGALIGTVIASLGLSLI
ncbi:MAG: phosphatase PAP2 family protein [Gammaproteobacteria bacterium]|nr:phosphatase PAP2 family protein [Gammaproteobacteria bacterium]